MTTDSLAVAYGVAVCLCVYLAAWVRALRAELRECRRAD